MATHNELGKAGEEIARQHLEEKGFRILEHGWRYRRAEVDLIALDGPILVFVEVKTRSSNRLGEPEYFVTASKERLLTSAAHAYIEQINHQDEIRFDLVSILYRSAEDYELRHLPDAFFPGL